MLELLKLEIGGMSGFYNLTIYNDLNTITYQYQLPQENDWQKGEFKGEKAVWLEKLEAVSIKSWRSNYIPLVKIFDGPMWSLEYKTVGKRWRHIRGSDCYPKNWNQFIDVINMLTPQFDLSDFYISDADMIDECDYE